MLKKIAGIDNRLKITILLVIDSTLCSATLLLSWFLWVYPEVVTGNLKWEMGVFVIIRILTFSAFRLYKYMWRYASVKAVLNIAGAITASTLIMIIVSRLWGSASLPIPIFFIDWAFAVLAIGGSRLSLRIYQDFLSQHLNKNRTEETKKRVVIIGAGDAGEIVAREIRRATALHYELVGFLDDDTQKKGRRIHGVPVLGPTENLVEIAGKHEIEVAIIAIPSAEGKDVRRLISLCEEAKIQSQITPGLVEIISGKVSLNQIRNVRIEDLLGRKVLEKDLALNIQSITNETVLITGAGGSIGSELSRQLCALSPKKIILLDNSEYALYKIEQEIQAMHSTHTQVIPIIADVKNKTRITKLFQEHAISAVYHAAAYKHVPLMECNVSEVIENNILGTQNMVSLSHQFSVQKFVLISTDKAVNASNVMGASKRVCEMLMQSQAAISQTVFTAVRFGNVLGSNGSVVPLFKKQIKKGGPVTVTHPEMTRYFMTIPEAVRLVIQAAFLSQGGEIFILDMGEPVKILSLAKDMIHLSGLEEEKDIKIVFTGLRPGEKLHEELSFEKETLAPTKNQKIFVTKPIPCNQKDLNEQIGKLSLEITSEEANVLRKSLLNLAAQCKASEKIEQLS